MKSICASYTHCSQVDPKSLKSGSFSPESADRIARAMGLEAFQYSETLDWWALGALDGDGYIEIPITRSLATSLDQYRI